MNKRKKEKSYQDNLRKEVFLGADKSNTEESKSPIIEPRTEEELERDDKALENCDKQVKELVPGEEELLDDLIVDDTDVVYMKALEQTSYTIDWNKIKNFENLKSVLNLLNLEFTFDDEDTTAVRRCIKNGFIKKK